MITLLTDTFSFESAYKVFPTEGNLVYEYNPFFNYRINETMVYYKERLWSLQEFAEKFVNEDKCSDYYYDTTGDSVVLLEYDNAIIKAVESVLSDIEYDSYTASVNDDGYIVLTYYTTQIDDSGYEFNAVGGTVTTTYIQASSDTIVQAFINETLDISEIEGGDWTTCFSVQSTDTAPVVYQSGQLVDFETEELSFSLNNPVNITPQWSYDNSVNLIINDGLNPPRLINSRFSPTERHQYQVCDRKGDNDTNIYDRGEQFDIDTSLYKKVTTIPRLKFNQVAYGGNLSIGNYHFYFKYVDEDGNESDFFAESGLVSIFIGSSADSIHSGFESENSHKLVKFILSNTDAGYAKVRVYYTRASSQVNQTQALETVRIDTLYYIQEQDYTVITITGYEPTVTVDKSEINLQYQIYGSAETQEQCQNMLFLANVDKPNIPYEDLADCALRFFPFLQTESYPVNQIGTDYSGSVSGTYYSPDYIYNKVGYWDDEIYRLGVVFILSDNTLSPVFNIRGIKSITTETTLDDYTVCDFFTEGGNRNYVSYDQQYYTIIGDSSPAAEHIENAKGVVQIDESGFDSVIGFNFYVPTEVIEYLTDTLGVLGMFFVRQKRIATTLAQAYTIGVDMQSYTPMLPVGEDEYQTESFLSKDTRYLEQDFSQRLRSLEGYLVNTTGALCPEYDINSPYLNNLFNGSELMCRNCSTTRYLKRSSRQYYPTSFSFNKSSGYTKVKIIGVEDNVKLVGIGDNYFRSRAGEAEEAFRFEQIGVDNKETEMENVIRGSYGPYLGITGYDYSGHLIDIKIPNYNPSYMNDYFSIRYNDKSAYYAISDRIDFTNLSDFFEDSETYSSDSDSDSDWDGAEYRILSNAVYRGDCYICQFTHRLNRNFQDPSAPTNDDIVDSECWADHFEVSDGVIDLESFDNINLGDVNAIMLGMWVTLVVRSTFNLNIRSIDGSNADETALTGHKRSFYPMAPMSGAGTYKIPDALCINQGFQKSLSERENFEMPDMPWIKNEFSNRIAYSNIQVQDAFQNGWRTFMGQHYRDYPKTYGSIIKLVEWGGDLVCVFEHGIGKISVNERALAGKGNGGNVYINTSNVLPENPIIYSDIYGSQWRESVIKTPDAIYGVDTIAKKIWKLSSQGLELISDFKIQEFLNDNISLSEREFTPIIGVRNVKSHYNKYKHDVMFTFYDNLYGFEECVWNLCYNELIKEWITFYSWVPSYSENIYNQFFSFDRNTSKWIAKLGISKVGNNFSDGVTLADNIIYDSSYKSELSLSNRTLPSGDNTTVTITYTLERDNCLNYKNFEIVTEDDTQYLKLKDGVEYSDLCSEFYYRINGDNSDVTPDDDDYTIDTTLTISTDDNGRRRWLDQELQKNSSTVVILLNIRANISVSYTGTNVTLEEYYATGSANLTTVDAGYYESVVAVMPYYNMQFLTTDFWKHGRAGIIDIADKIYPCYWYGKQHPFEFEFVVNDKEYAHKIFDNLQIISNNAEPESFHYEIIGDCYDFAKDKKNMYIRQEATKELYQYNELDITYDSDYSDLESEQRESGMTDSDGNVIYDKSTLLPLYYSRQDTINEIEDYYHLKDDVDTKNFSQLAGGEIVHYEKLDEYRIWNHAKAVDISEEGRMRGNMQYVEDLWKVQINPINIVQKNEEKWTDLDGNETTKVPVELNQQPVPGVVLESDFEVPDTDGWTNRGYVQWGWDDSQIKEVKLKDKWIKIRIRYSGEKLAIISAINTLYSESYS